MHRRAFLILAGLTGVAPLARAQSARKATLYKNPQCGCCEDYASYLRSHGYSVDVVATHDLDAIKSKNHVPEALSGCHTTLIGGYVVEGHVPVTVIERLLKERPALRGVSLPGMPAGSPGMTGRKQEPFKILEIAVQPSAKPAVYAVE
jgi:hypothetical protein